MLNILEEIGAKLAFYVWIIGNSIMSIDDMVSRLPIWAVFFAAAIAKLLILALLLLWGIRALRKPMVSGREGMIGRVLTAKTDIDPVGKLFTEGTWWTVETDEEPIKAGEKIKITGIDGLTIKVIKADTLKEEH